MKTTIYMHVWLLAGASLMAHSIVLAWYSGTTDTDLLTGTQKSYTAGPPNIISTPPRDQAVLGGSSTYFTCSVTWLNREHLEWRFFVDPSDPSDYGIVIFVTGIGVQDPTKHEVDSSYTLRVKNANTYDAGFYRCGLQVRQKYHFAELTVMTKVVCATMPSTSLLVGGIAEFECSLTFRGSSPPNMTWSASLKDGVHNKTIFDSGYAVYRVQKEVDVWMDNREFYCQLSFQKGSSNLYTDSCSTSVTVQVAARNITVLHNDIREVSDVVHVQEGDTFHCYAEGKPAPSFSWVKLLESVPDSEYNGSVLAINPDMGHGLHEYSCIASNIIGGLTYTQNKTISFYINNVPMYVEEPPTDTLVMENSEVTLKCSVNEDAGKGWIEWWFQGNHRLYSSRYPDSVASGYDINGTYNLIIKRVSDFNSGSYECRLFPNGTRYMAELVVLKDLTCDRFLVASIPSKKKTQEIDDVINDEVALQTGVSKFGWNGNTWLPRTGQYVQVTCSVSYHGNLVPRVLWHNEETGDMQSHYSHQGRSIQGDAYIVASARYHNKLFTCLVDLNNNGGIKQEGQTCSGRMSVQFLQNLRITPDSFEAYGGVLRLTVGQEILCEAEGHPQPRLAWQRVAGYGDDKIDGGVLKTTALMQRSLNIYECLAWNDDGFIEIEKRKLTHFYVN